MFHSNRVKATERLYVHNEAGIADFFLPKGLKPDWLRSHESDTTSHVVWGPLQMSNEAHSDDYSSPMIEEVDERSSPAYWNASRNDQLPTPPEDTDESSHASDSDQSTPPLDSRAYPFPSTVPGISSPVARRNASARTNRDIQAHSNEPGAVLLPALLDMSSLQHGDSLFWHHLVRFGEIPACTDHKEGRGVRIPPVVF